jgi:hypothetical protein
LCGQWQAPGQLKPVEGDEVPGSGCATIEVEQNLTGRVGGADFGGRESKRMDGRDEASVGESFKRKQGSAPEALL